MNRNEKPGDLIFSNLPGVSSVVLYVAILRNCYHNVKCYFMYYIN